MWRATTSSPGSASSQRDGHPLAHLDTGRPLAEAAGEVVSANAYLGGLADRRGPGRRRRRGGLPRITDASLVVGPAAWHHGWAPTDWDRLAGAVVAGHVIECGPQATGGNYAFFTEVDGLEHPGFPIAEVAEDGSSVITKHPGTGGEVSVGTVTAQLLYEIGGPSTPTPTWWPGSTPSPSSRSAPTGCGSPVPGAGPPPTSQGLHQPARAVGATR